MTGRNCSRRGFHRNGYYDVVGGAVANLISFQYAIIINAGAQLARFSSCCALLSHYARKLLSKMKPIGVFLLLSSALQCCARHRVEYVLIADNQNDCERPSSVSVQYRRPTESWNWKSLMNLTTVKGLFNIMHEHMILYYFIFLNSG